MQLGRARPGEQPVPQRATPMPATQRQLALGDPEADRPLQPGDVGEQVADVVLAARRRRSATRKIAASVIGVRIASAPVGCPTAYLRSPSWRRAAIAVE